MTRLLVLLACLFAPLPRTGDARAADALPEYRLKAAFLYNFALLTEWPAELGPTINLCVLGPDPFGEELDALQGRNVGRRVIGVRRLGFRDPVSGCQMLYIAPSAMASLPRLLDAVGGTPVLTVADSPDAAREGVAINMLPVQSKIGFEVNLRSARGAGLHLSSKLLRLAGNVYQ